MSSRYKMVLTKNSYKLLSEPNKAYKEIFSSLKRAKKSIYIETFKILEDEIGLELIKILDFKAKKENVKVKLIVDYWGMKNSTLNKLNDLKSKNFDVVVFNPLHITIRAANIRKFLEKLHNRNHRKLILVDEKIAFVGGMNFHKNELKWADIVVKIRGPILDMLILASHEMIGIAKKIKFFKRRKIYKTLNKEFRNQDLVIRQVPGRINNKFKKNILNLIRNSKKEIILTTPYFTPDFQITRALKKALKRGVDVTIIIPNHCDSFVADVVNKSFAFLIYKEGITIQLFKGMIHAKFLLVDEEVCTFGSSNFDYQTWIHNYELNIISKDPYLVRDLKKYSDRIIEHSIAFTKRMWWNRSLKRKIIGRLIRPFKRHF